MVDLGKATVIVTGASSGIGEQTVRTFAEEGANVVLSARREDTLQKIASDVESEYNVEALVVPTDVSEVDACERLIDETIDAFGQLDVLVNNAGIGLGGDVAELTTEEYRAMMGVNVDGCFFTTRAALPHLRDGGHLIYLGSFAGQYPRPFNPVYASTKWWVRGFAHSVAAQVGDEDIAVTVVNPAEVRSEFGNQDGKPFRERFEPGTASEPEDIAAAIVYAASTGHTAPLEIDLYRRDKLASAF